MNREFIGAYIIFLIIEAIALIFFVLRQREKFKIGVYNPYPLIDKQKGDFRDFMIYMGILLPPGLIDTPILKSISITTALFVVIIIITIYNLKSISFNKEHKGKIIVETVVFDLLILLVPFLYKICRDIF